MRAGMFYLGRSKWIGAGSASIIPFSRSDTPGKDRRRRRCRHTEVPQGKADMSQSSPFQRCYGAIANR